MTRRLVPLLALAALVLGGCAATRPAGPDPQGAVAAVTAYTEALSRRDWTAAGAQIAPAELEKLRGVLGMMAAFAPAEGFEDVDFGEGPEMFGAFIDFMVDAEPLMGDAMANLAMTPLGVVEEAPGVVHVVARAQSTMMGIETSSMDVTTVRWIDGAWKLDLAGDVQTFVQAMEAAASGGLGGMFDDDLMEGDIIEDIELDLEDPPRPRWPKK